MSDMKLILENWRQYEAEETNKLNEQGYHNPSGWAARGDRRDDREDRKLKRDRRKEKRAYSRLSPEDRAAADAATAKSYRDRGFSASTDVQAAKQAQDAAAAQAKQDQIDQDQATIARAQAQRKASADEATAALALSLIHI